MIFTQDDIYIFMMVFMRVSAMFLLIPFFAGKLVPRHMRVVIAGFVTLMVVPAFTGNALMPNSLPEFVAMGLKEMLIGLLMGFAVRMVFFSIEFAGHIISTEVGLMMSHTFDPVDNQQSSTISTLLFYLTVLLFFITGTHKHILSTFIQSFNYIPLHASLFAIEGNTAIITGTNRVFALGLQIAAPLIALNFIINMTFAVLGKAAPKINVFMISFAVRILAGLSLLSMALYLIVQYLFHQIETIPQQMIQFITS